MIGSTPVRWAFKAMMLGLMAMLVSGGWTDSPTLPAFCMTTDEIKPGMEGVGRTVFAGYEVETFKVHILGVEHNAMPGTHLILARLEGKFLEQHGVVAGMSGSPVFIDGRLIGAVAYGWTFAYQPYCGITPIEQMWTVWENIGQPGLTLGDAPKASATGAGAFWDWESAWGDYKAQIDGTAKPQPAGESTRPTHPALAGLEGELKPLMSPLMLSGASPRAERRLKRFFACRGIEVVGAGTLAGSGGGSANDPAPPIEPGSSVAVPMMTGDLSMAGTGTVTWCEGDKLIAFGHPMFFAGATRVPMAKSYIFGFMQSYSRSFKMGEVRETVGTIVQDRQYAIGGVIGPVPAQTAISVRVDGPAVSRPRTYHFSAWRDAEYLPLMTVTAFEDSYLASVSESGRVRTDTDYRVKLSDGRLITKRFTTSSKYFPLVPPGNSLLFDLYMLLNNPYEEAAIEAIDVHIIARPGFREDVLVSMLTDHSVYKAGDAVRLTATFQAWREEEYQKAFSIDLPEDLRPGAYVIHLADAQGMEQIERRNRPGLYRPRGYEDIVRLVRGVGHSADELGLYLVQPEVGVDIEGQVLGGLPTSIQPVMQATASPRVRSSAVGRILSVRTEKAAAPVYGSSSVAIRIAEMINE